MSGLHVPARSAAPLIVACVLSESALTGRHLEPAPRRGMQHWVRASLLARPGLRFASERQDGSAGLNSAHVPVEEL